MDTPFKELFHQHVLDLQDRIVEEMKKRDPGLNVIEDHWQRSDFAGNPGGGGRTRAISGAFFENAGVNVSCVHGKVDPSFAKQMGGTSDSMWASGISLILHPYNPRIPTVHANFRMIIQGEKWWFGGGGDLTPFYPHPEDFQHFHRTWKEACGDEYEGMKKTCDEYFVNRHRGQEMRGIGGVFFDHYQRNSSLEETFAWVKKVSEFFIPSYFPIVDKRLKEPFTSEDEDFQLYRRGRYVEFNLLHDRGTMFGLKTGGRTESILISLPARCKFGYQYAPPAGGLHADMMKHYQPGTNWI
jgi:coproporphyrinogen III oxidase